MGLKEILNRFRSCSDGCRDCDKIIRKAHTDILKWIADELPKDKGFCGFSSWQEGHTNGYNAYRQEALTKLGIRKGEG